MRHRNAGRKLSRNASHRDAMMRNMVTSLFELERIQTTEAKAKELRRFAEKLITAAKRNASSVVAAAANDDERSSLEGSRLAAIRQAARVVRTRDVVQKLFGDLAERYVDRPGGYTRILRVGRRAGDGAEMVIIELVRDAADATIPAPESMQAEADAAT